MKDRKQKSKRLGQAARSRGIADAEFITLELDEPEDVDDSGARREVAPIGLGGDPVQLRWWEPDQEDGDLLVEYRGELSAEWPAIMERLANGQAGRFVVVIGPRAPRGAEADNDRRSAMECGHIWESVEGRVDREVIRKKMEERLSDELRRISAYIDDIGAEG